MFLRRNGIILGNLENLNVLDAELISARRPLFFADSSPEDDRRLLGELIEFLKKLISLFPADDGCLEDSRAVPDENEPDFSARTFVLNPAPELDLLVFESGDFFDVNPFHDGRIICDPRIKVNRQVCIFERDVLC